MDLVVWKEKGLSSVDEADDRYRRILDHEETVPFSALDQSLQAFIEQASEKFPAAVLTSRDAGGSTGGGYSRYGVVLRFGVDMAMDALPGTTDIATPLELTIYDPEMELVIGYDDSLDITVVDDD
jgi:hypothetical protein